MENVYELLRQTQETASHVISRILEKDYLSAIATIAASFFGAMFAFRLQQKEKDRERRQQEIAQAGAALQCLFRMADTVGGYKANYVNPIRGMRQVAGIMLAPSLPEDVDRERFNFDGLSFLSDKEGQQVVADLWLEERRFHNLMKAINRRSKVHLDQYQPVAEAKALHQRGGITLQELRTEVGPRVVDELVRTTEFIIKDVDDTLASLQRAKDQFHVVLRKRFPKQKFLDFELISIPGDQDSSTAPQAPGVETDSRESGN